MIEVTLKINGSQILINDFTIVNDFGLIVIFIKNEKINWDEWTEQISGHNLEKAIQYCMEQSK